MREKRDERKKRETAAADVRGKGRLMRFDFQIRESEKKREKNSEE